MKMIGMILLMTTKNQRFLVPIADAGFMKTRSVARIVATISRRRTPFLPANPGGSSLGYCWCFMSSIAG